MHIMQPSKNKHKDDFSRIRLSSKNMLQAQNATFDDELEGKNQNVPSRDLRSLTMPNWMIVPV